MDLPQFILSKHLSKPDVSDLSEQSDSSTDSDQNFAYLDEIFENSDQITTKRMLGYFAENDLKLK